MPQHRDLSDAEWEALDPLIPEPQRRKDGRGRPWRGRREVLNGILYILRTGSAWADLPDCYPPYQTCHRRFQEWLRSGVIREVLEGLAEDIRVREELDLRTASIDDVFVSAGRRSSVVKVSRSWRWRVASGSGAKWPVSPVASSS